MNISGIQELAVEECLRLLRRQSVGRIAVVVDEFPFVVPVNYRLAEVSGRTWLVVRTRPGNMVDRASMRVAFEIDGIDPIHRQGWSVLVRGTFQHLGTASDEFRARFDPKPWLSSERDAWLVIEPFAITGRRLGPPEFEWALHRSGVPLKPNHARAAIPVPAQARRTHDGRSGTYGPTASRC